MLHHSIFVSKDLFRVFLWWLDRQHLSQGMPSTSPNTTITTDAGMVGWGGHCIVLGSGTALYSDLWTRDTRQFHIDMLEFRVVCLALLHVEQEVLYQMILILIESDNTATVSYINRQGGVVSKTLNYEACTLFKWLIPRVMAIHQPGVHNELADFLSHNLPNSTEWHLSERVVLQLFHLCSTPQVDLFTNHLNHQLPFTHWQQPPTPCPKHEQGCHFMPCPQSRFLRRCSSRTGRSGGQGHCHCPSWLSRSWYHLLQMAYEIPLLLPCRRDILSQCLPNKGTFFHTDLKTIRLTGS